MSAPPHTASSEVMPGLLHLSSLSPSPQTFALCDHLNSLGLGKLSIPSDGGVLFHAVSSQECLTSVLPATIQRRVMDKEPGPYLPLLFGHVLLSNPNFFKDQSPDLSPVSWLGLCFCQQAPSCALPTCQGATVCSHTFLCANRLAACFDLPPEPPDSTAAILVDFPRCWQHLQIWSSLAILVSNSDTDQRALDCSSDCLRLSSLQ